MLLLLPAKRKDFITPSANQSSTIKLTNQTLRFRARDEIVRRRMMDLVIIKILNFRPKNLVVKRVSILKIIPCPKI